MFTFPVMSDEEIKSMQNNLVEPGIYAFEVSEVQDKDANNDPLKSLAGNLMIKLKLKIWNNNGRERIVFDYLVSMESMVYKIKHFCESIGFTYEDGQFNPQKCIGKFGHLELSIQKGKKKPDSNDFYPDKNAVKDYIKADTNKTVPGEDPLDDDIPF